jgi:hypothetical protein
MNPAVAAMKGKLVGVAAPAAFNGIMERVAAPDSVTFEQICLEAYPAGGRNLPRPDGRRHPPYARSLVRRSIALRQMRLRISAGVVDCRVSYSRPWRGIKCIMLLAGRRTRRAFITLAAVSLPASRLLAQTEFWNTKDPNTYSEEEKYRVLHSSPWATTARAEAPRGVDRGPTLVPATPVGEQTGPPSKGGGRVMTLPSLDATPPVEDANSRESLAFYGQVTIRWESAIPILQITRSVLPVEFLNHYVISVTGLPAGVLSIGWHLASAALAARGHSFERAEFVGLAGDKLALLFAFQKLRPPIKESDRTLSFVMNLSGIKVKATFQPKGMTYRGQLEL